MIRKDVRLKLSEIAARLGLELKGPDREVTGINTLEDAGPGEVSFLANPKYVHLLAGTRAAAVVCDPGHADAVDSALVADNPYLAMARVATLFVEPQGCFTGHSQQAYIHPEAEVDDSAVVHPFVFVGARSRVDAGSRLFPGVYVGEDCVVGRDCILFPNSSLLRRCRLGDRVTLHAGVVVGGDGFGYAPSPEGLFKVPQMGGVVIGNDVEVGASTTIDRGSLGQTVIGDGVKIDNLVQIAHNVHIGDHSVIVAQVGIAGSTSVGRGVMIGGQSAAVGHIHIGDGCKIAARSAVTTDLEPGSNVSGAPAQEHRKNMRVLMSQNRVPDLVRKVRALEAEIASIKASLDDKGEEHG
jgi:UDP-3-O-[3-hydroxymyristoyl] glucosamine N-acyltransferase